MDECFKVDLLMDWEGVRWAGDPEFRLEHEISKSKDLKEEVRLTQ